MSLAATVWLGAWACSTGSGTVFGPDSGLQLQERSGVVFMTQSVVPETMMDALYRGPIVLAEDGCLRLQTPEAPTAVWPKGFTTSVEGEQIRVLDADGELVLTVGEKFDLPGGEVPELSDAMGFDQDDRDLAASRCAGRYWIVGPI